MKHYAMKPWEKVSNGVGMVAGWAAVAAFFFGEEKLGALLGGITLLAILVFVVQTQKMMRRIQHDMEEIRQKYE